MRKVLATGKAMFKDKCQRCHGPGGQGRRPDADPDAQEDMDLTSANRAARNPDGVVFYKVWNGRKKPKMPAFKDDLTKDQVWAVVAYVADAARQSLNVRRCPRRGSRRLSQHRVISSPIT